MLTQGLSTTMHQEYSIESYTPTELGGQVTVYRARRTSELSAPTYGNWHTDKEVAARDMFQLMSKASYLNTPDNVHHRQLSDLLIKYDFTPKPDDFDFLIKE